PSIYDTHRERASRDSSAAERVGEAHACVADADKSSPTPSTCSTYDCHSEGRPHPFSLVAAIADLAAAIDIRIAAARGTPFLMRSFTIGGVALLERARETSSSMSLPAC